MIEKLFTALYTEENAHHLMGILVMPYLIVVDSQYRS